MRILGTSLILAILLASFVLGWTLNDILVVNPEKPFSFSLTKEEPASNEKLSPGDHVLEKDIHVYEDNIILDIAGASWSSFADSNSMDPLIDNNANGLEIIPDSIEDIHKGDIISYDASFTSGLVVHRVIETGYDEFGWYALTKGDNNEVYDPSKVRFEDINGIVIGVLY